ncbi:MAG: rane-flanked domain [Marmoricola sp.]|nr:rane-flanked domain [Marmoricola sp.]
MTELAHDAAWRRLDIRMLLVHPVNELIRFLPLLVGLFFLGSRDSSNPWHYLSVAIPIAIGLMRFATTRFRITGVQIELRRGLFSRNVLTTPLDRVRTVELTAKPIHRILGLERVEIGTGSASRSGEGRVVLDALGADEAKRLRAELLRAGAADSVDAPGTGPHLATQSDTVLLRFDPAWARFAPLTTSGLVIVLAALAASGQFLGNAIPALLHRTDVGHHLRSLPLVVTVPAGLISFLVVISVLAIAGYLLANWGFTLSRDAVGSAFHVRRGALTTRQTSIDPERLRGVEIHEPLGLRLAGAGRLTAIVTGFKKNAQGSTPMVPAAPVGVVIGVGEQVLAENGPLYTGLVGHGPRATRRRYIRAIVPTALVPAVLLLAALGGAPLWVGLVALLLPAAGVLLARDRAARLGHALTPAYVVVRWGSLRGRRDALQRTGIIGWNLRQSWFQRRAGLVSLTATTAAGRQSYEVLDLPEPMAIALAAAAVPSLVDQFLVRPGVRSIS